MVARICMITAMVALVAGSVAFAAPGGGGHGAGGGTVSRGASGGGRTIVGTPYGLGLGAGCGNNFGGGSYYGLNGGRCGGAYSAYYGNIGFGGIGVPLVYGTGYYTPPPVMEPVLPPPPPPVAPTPAVPLAAGPATIAFSVPENAMVWVNNNLLDQTGSERDFTTPALGAGAFGSYLVRVKWMENGEEKSFSQRVNVRAAGRASVTIFGRSDRR